MRRSCYIVGRCVAIAVMASACGGDSGAGSVAPGSGGVAFGGGGSAGSEPGPGGASARGGTAATGGAPATGGRSTTGGTSAGGTGGSDCLCLSAAWEPVCGVDGNTYNAVCGADCVPVDIACVGECPCDASGTSCDIGCAAYSDTGWCESPTVEWVCDGIDHLDLFIEIGCQDLATGLARYCCPAGFLSACQ